MTLQKFYVPVCLLLCQLILAQADTITLQEVVITDTQLKDYSATQSVQVLNDSVIRLSRASLTSLLANNSVIYFKENGLGMVSSPSFRGTTAQQTAVVWNGININSQLNGQTDFNTLNVHDFDNVTVRAGGGSVIYGSSAIGGSVHLNTHLTFDDTFSNTVRLEYGSYNTFNGTYSLTASGHNTSAGVTVNRNSSDNDYKYPGTDLRNDNGQYYNTSVNTAFAYKVDNKNTLKFYSHIFDSERHFSRTLAAVSRSKYNDVITRNLFEWEGKYGRFTSKLKAAYLEENYKYFEDHAADAYDFGRVKTYIARYDAAFNISRDIQLNAITDYVRNTGEGSDIIAQKRDIASTSLLIKHYLNSKFVYEAGIRKELTDDYKSPILFSLGVKYAATEIYSIRLNASRNFRIPTFNDLYWQGSGNPDLNPETSYQAEVGNELTFKNATLTVTGYYIKLRDMLRWVPRGSQWGPENLGRVNTYGVESVFNWSRKSGPSTISVTGTYAYTVSREEGRTEQLIYVPFHKATGSLAYAYRNITAYYRHLCTGKVFYTSDNQSEINAYNVASIGAEYKFKLFEGLTLGMQVLNLFDENYQNVVMRPLPGRNYTMYLNFKF